MDEERAKDCNTSKYADTIIIYSCFVIYGLLSTTTACSLLDLAELMNCRNEQISIGLSIRAVAYSITALTCGWLFDRINRKIGLIVALTANACFSLPVPLIKSLNYYWFSQAIAGFSYSAIDVAASAWILELWPHKSNTFSQALHLCFSIGDAIAPLIVRPFLSHRVLGASNQTTSLTDLKFLVTDESRIYIPYIIVSCVSFAVTLLLISWHVWESCFKSTSWMMNAVIERKEMNETEAASAGAAGGSKVQGGQAKIS